MVDTLDTSLDRSDMLGWLADYPRQLEALYGPGREAGAAVNAGFAQRAGEIISDVLVLGTGGGSAAAAYVTSALTRDRLLVPFTVSQGYDLPVHVTAAAGPADRPGRGRSLIVAVSHSGQTEETLAAVEALPDGARAGLVVISGGGPLTAAARGSRRPLIDLPTGMQARAVFPGILAALLGLLDGAGLTTRSFAGELAEAAELCGRLAAAWRPDTLPLSPGSPGRAPGGHPSPLTPLDLARRVSDRLLLVYGGAGATAGVARRWKNQLAENGKTLAHWYTVPEAHHDEVVGWDAPEAVREHLFACLLRDAAAESPKMKRRLDVTRDILAGRLDGVVEVWAEGSSPLARALSLCLYGDFLSCYVALIRGLDPTPVPVIVELKREMARD
ncbi:MAG: SIS domain-containing protein [Bacillota bacterium]